ncbi:hypothetical protein D5086_020047 [Populus alba]|uniref:Uncharacterized protein n=1 Tax=Populus alba TaxID=43335 RepID=A0ACC4BIW7_POPAL
MQPSGHRWTFMKAPVIGFQILLFMRLEGTSPGAEHIPCLILCSTFFDSRSWGFAVYRLVEKIVLLLNSGAGSGRYFAVTSNAQDYFGFLHNGSRSFPLPVFQGFKMCIGMSKDMLVQPIDFWYQCSVLCYGNECFHLWRNRIGRSHSIIWCYGAMILESHHYTRKYSDLFRASSALPFAKVLKALPSYQFRFDQMSTDIRSQALFDHGKLAWPNVSHELPALSYNTFPAEIVKKQPKSELVHEVQTVLPVQ